MVERNFFQQAEAVRQTYLSAGGDAIQEKTQHQQEATVSAALRVLTKDRISNTRHAQNSAKKRAGNGRETISKPTRRIKHTPKTGGRAQNLDEKVFRTSGTRSISEYER